MFVYRKQYGGTDTSVSTYPQWGTRLVLVASFMGLNVTVAFCIWNMWNAYVIVNILNHRHTLYIECEVDNVIYPHYSDYYCHIIIILRHVYTKNLYSKMLHLLHVTKQLDVLLLLLLSHFQSSQRGTPQIWPTFTVWHDLAH